MFKSLVKPVLPALVIGVTAFGQQVRLNTPAVMSTPLLAGMTMQRPVSSATPAPLVISIASPASDVITTNLSTISLSGTASGGAGITRVTWQTSHGVCGVSAITGATGVASGAASWVATDIPLPAGTTTIVMRAYDAKGATAWVASVAVRP